MPANHEMTSVCFGITKVQCQWHLCASAEQNWNVKCLTSLSISFLSLICPCMICLKWKICKEKKKQKDQNTLYMIACVYSRRCRSYRMYFKGDSFHQTVMIVCELKWFSHISDHYNMYILMQSYDIFHTQHAIFFATLDTCAVTMWFGHHKVYMC